MPPIAPTLAITTGGWTILVLLAVVGLACIVAGYRSLRAEDVDQASRRHWWMVLIFMVALPLAGFALLAHAVIQPQGISWDVAILRHILLSYSPTVEHVMRVISDTDGVLGVSLLAAAATAGLLLARLNRIAVFLLSTTIAGMVVNALLKQIFERTRPEIIPYYRIAGYSFPSGHTAGDMTFALAVLVVLHATRWRWWLAIAAVAWAVAVGFSRVYLGVHYPSDVLAGWAIASCVVGIGWLLFWADLRPQRFASVAPGARSEAAATRRGAVSSGPAADGDALPEPTGTDDRTLSGEE